MKRKGFSILFALVLVITFSLVTAVPAMAATTYTVDDDWQIGVPPYPEDTDGDNDFATIQAAINAAGSGDTVYVRSGTYYEHVTIGKSLILQGEDRDTTVIDGGGSGSVIYMTKSYVTVSGFTVTNGDYGVDLIGDWVINHITIRDVIITSTNQFAFYAVHSGGYHLIEDCIISNNFRASYAHQFGNSIIRNCEVFGNGGGLSVAWGSGTLITNNRVHHNGAHGIWFDSMSNSIMEKNEVYNNGVGIGVGYVGKDNTLRDNIVHHNTVGIEMNYPPVIGNKVYHNALIENTLQVLELGSNIWDNGYPSGGNYWSDYAGVDDFSGPAQNLPGSDGIGDTPYAFTGNQDNYPLMTPWGAIAIDIKPGSDPNSINLKSKGVIPVAILTTPDFDATTVDASTVTFGPDAATMVHKSAYLEDVDGDGNIDMVLHFETQETGMAPGDTSAMLVGWTYDSRLIVGVDSVRTIPAK